MIATPVYNNLAAYVDLFGMKSEQGKILTIEKQKREKIRALTFCNTPDVEQNEI